MIKYAHDFFARHTDGDFLCGFNRRVLGEEMPTYPSNIATQNGWWKADEMARDGKIFFVHPFHDGCKGYAFLYGGHWVCNTCGHGNLFWDWWAIKVMRDGSAYCCVGAGFINLQESDNYAFGDTREEAIQKYGELMATMPKGE
jgi:hypothetical protein